MNQKSFWSGMAGIVTSALIIGYLIEEIAPSQVGYVFGAIIFLVLYGWTICNLYSRLLSHKISFENYQLGVVIFIAITVLVSIFWNRSEFVDSLPLILVGIMLYTNSILMFYGRANQLTHKDKQSGI